MSKTKLSDNDAFKNSRNMSAAKPPVTDIPRQPLLEKNSDDFASDKNESNDSRTPDFFEHRIKPKRFDSL